MQALRDYKHLIADIDRLCSEIRQAYGDHIVCKKGCPGNCCQRHITVFPIEALGFARALQKLSPDLAIHIRRNAGKSNSLGPCPLLQNGACLMYESRAIICRTHGYPILHHYHGHRTIGYCHKNFKKIPSHSFDRTIELAPLNNRLIELNRRLLADIAGRWAPADRLTVGEALLLDLPFI